jgi:predicted SnoaL-like aldol condensation-catalyzing enzyme
LSGIWHVANRIPCTPDFNRFVPCGLEIGGSPLALNIGTGLTGGLPYQPWAATADANGRPTTARTIRTRAAAGQSSADVGPAAYDEDRAHTETAGHAVRGQRDVSADLSRWTPMPDGSDAGWNGYSVGTWEGDALVVQTTGFRDNLWIDMGGSPMSDAATMTERLRRTSFGTLGSGNHRRRPESLQTPVDGLDEPGPRARHRADRRVLPGRTRSRRSACRRRRQRNDRLSPLGFGLSARSRAKSLKPYRALDIICRPAEDTDHENFDTVRRHLRSAARRDAGPRAGARCRRRQSGSTLPHPDPKLNANKQVVYAIFRDLLEANHWELADKYLTERYIQHNPNAASGRAGVIAFFTEVMKVKPTPIQQKLRSKIVSVTAEGDMVSVAWPREYKDPKDPSKTYSTTWFDMWRIKDGKADEHWDSAMKN